MRGPFGPVTGARRSRFCGDRIVAEFFHQGFSPGSTDQVADVATTLTVEMAMCKLKSRTSGNGYD